MSLGFNGTIRRAHQYSWITSDTMHKRIHWNSTLWSFIDTSVKRARDTASFCSIRVPNQTEITRWIFNLAREYSKSIYPLGTQMWLKEWLIKQTQALKLLTKRNSFAPNVLRGFIMLLPLWAMSWFLCVFVCVGGGGVACMSNSKAFCSWCSILYVCILVGSVFGSS